jgi:hypothetical protein
VARTDDTIQSLFNDIPGTFKRIRWIVFMGVEVSAAAHSCSWMSQIVAITSHRKEIACRFLTSSLVRSFMIQHNFEDGNSSSIIMERLRAHFGTRTWVFDSMVVFRSNSQKTNLCIHPIPSLPSQEAVLCHHMFINRP